MARNDWNVVVHLAQMQMSGKQPGIERNVQEALNNFERAVAAGNTRGWSVR